MKDLYPVILSGGSGTRLWPVSRRSLPKQFIKFNKIGTLFNHTLGRIHNLNKCRNLIVVSARDHEFIIKKNLQELHISPALILEEISKNTSAAIYFAAKSALEKSDNAILCVMPSDHWIEDFSKFKTSVMMGYKDAQNHNWVTFGVKPASPSTGYGYIKTENINNIDNENVIKFIEKPDIKKAKKLFKSSNYYWNAGIFMVSALKTLESFKIYQPRLTSELEKAWSNRLIDLNRYILPKIYMNEVENISVDKAIMESEKDIKLVPLKSDWSDIGNWDSMSTLLNKFNNSNVNTILIDSKNIQTQSSERLIVGIGLEDLTIIDEADATLIFKKGQSEKVKSVVEKLSADKNKIALEHNYEFRPWGKFEILLDSHETKVKRIFVDPLQSLSYQYHKHRSEHWTIVEGQAEVVLDGVKKVCNVGESISIPKGIKHSLSNFKNDILIVIEVQYGNYFGEDDIIRLTDPYDRN